MEVQKTIKINPANFVKNRQIRLAKFTNKYIGKNGQGQELGRFMSLEAVLLNAEDDIEMLRLGFYDSK